MSCNHQWEPKEMPTKTILVCQHCGKGTDGKVHGKGKTGPK